MYFLISKATFFTNFLTYRDIFLLRSLSFALAYMGGTLNSKNVLGQKTCLTVTGAFVKENME